MKNAWRWLSVLCLIWFVAVGVTSAAAQVPPGYEPEVELLNPKVLKDNSANNQGNSGLIEGGVTAKPSKSSQFWSRVGDHALGAVKGIGAGLIGAAIVVGVAALVVGAGAPLLLMAGAAVLGGAIYGAIAGSARFNWTEAIVGSVIGGVSAGVGSWIAGTGSSLITRAGVAAVDMIGGGLVNTVSYLVHESNPTWGGAAGAFSIGVGTAAAFMGAGAVVSKTWRWAKGALGFGRTGQTAPASAAVEKAILEGTPESAPHPASAGRLQTKELVEGAPGSSPETTPSTAGRPKHATNPPGPGEAIQWPPNDGFYGQRTKTILKPGTLVDRFGRPGGSFLSPEGTPFGQRALPPHYESSQQYHVYEVVKPLEVEEGLIEPWFGQPGMGTQYLTSVSVQDLLDAGVLREVSR